MKKRRDSRKKKGLERNREEIYKKRAGGKDRDEYERQNDRGKKV